MTITDIELQPISQSGEVLDTDNTALLAQIAGGGLTMVLSAANTAVFVDTVLDKLGASMQDVTVTVSADQANPDRLVTCLSPKAKV